MELTDEGNGWLVSSEKATEKKEEKISRFHELHDKWGLRLMCPRYDRNKTRSFIQKIVGFKNTWELEFVLENDGMEEMEITVNGDSVKFPLGSAFVVGLQLLTLRSRQHLE